MRVLLPVCKLDSRRLLYIVEAFNIFQDFMSRALLFDTFSPLQALSMKGVTDPTGNTILQPKRHNPCLSQLDQPHKSRPRVVCDPSPRPRGEASGTGLVVVQAYRWCCLASQLVVRSEANLISQSLNSSMGFPGLQRLEIVNCGQVYPEHSEETLMQLTRLTHLRMSKP